MKKILLAILVIALLATLVYFAYVLPVMSLRDMDQETITSTERAALPVISTTTKELPVIANPSATQLPVFTVTGLVYVRDFTGDPVGYVHPGDKVQCRLSGDWCLLENGTKVWSGCLEPNLSDKECKSK